MKWDWKADLVVTLAGVLLALVLMAGPADSQTWPDVVLLWTNPDSLTDGRPFPLDQADSLELMMAQNGAPAWGYVRREAHYVPGAPDTARLVSVPPGVYHAKLRQARKVATGFSYTPIDTSLVWEDPPPAWDIDTLDWRYIWNEPAWLTFQVPPDVDSTGPVTITFEVQVYAKGRLVVE